MTGVQTCALPISGEAEKRVSLQLGNEVGRTLASAQGAERNVITPLETLCRAEKSRQAVLNRCRVLRGGFRSTALEWEQDKKGEEAVERAKELPGGSVGARSLVRVSNGKVWASLQVRLDDAGVILKLLRKEASQYAGWREAEA